MKSGSMGWNRGVIIIIDAEIVSAIDSLVLKDCGLLQTKTTYFWI